jgi:hypothetical protein
MICRRNRSLLADQQVRHNKYHNQYDVRVEGHQLPAEDT